MRSAPLPPRGAGGARSPRGCSRCLGLSGPPKPLERRPSLGSWRGGPCRGRSRPPRRGKRPSGVDRDFFAAEKISLCRRSQHFLCAGNDCSPRRQRSWSSPRAPRLIAGRLCVAGAKGILKLRLDDAVDAIPAHLLNGAWGVLSVGFLASPERLLAACGRDKRVGWRASVSFRLK